MHRKLDINIVRNKERACSVAVAVILALLPVFDPYIIGSIGGFSIKINDLLLIGSFIVSSASSSGRRRYYSGLLRLLALFFGLTLCSFLMPLGDRSMLLAFRILLQSAVYVYCFERSVAMAGETSLFIGIVTCIAKLACLFAIIQFVLVGYFGIDIWDGVLPLPINETDGFVDLTSSGAGLFRVRAFFQEPSYLSIYLTPPLMYSCKKRQYFTSLLLATGIVVTGSFIGTLGLFFSLLILVFDSLRRGDGDLTVDFRYVALSVCIIIIICIIMSLIYINGSFPLLGQIIDNFTEKVKSIFDIENQYYWGRSSAQLRLLGNIGLFELYSPLQQLIGVGWNQYQAVFSSLISTGYSSSLVSTILNCGIVGGVSLCAWMICTLVRARMIWMPTFLFLIVCICTDNILFNGYFFYLLACSYLMREIGNANRSVHYCKSAVI